ncbi:hypothetical protein CONCODRAFT_9321 [Conidiobolus coronatus NRRL 28638]|uniref:Uncharacterized protein n=1 Tax=Conidiobolus coronatus (strain ATCC 28846 / CBS 209.66 / NRRL 28638) TaxID=796925 RepID=A0A137P0M7_CONC2|nr:hypothetical protein CONCODRAFT_9321 [Conidiobolus coronatus NRRL 28638]|eukprot:KXN68431.1 hypothetical protein CONCODRAFT_9321 [Conidiobolus coronatus NRRL 28638]
MDVKLILWIGVATIIVVLIAMFFSFRLSINSSQEVNEIERSRSARVHFMSLFTIYRRSSINLVTLNREFTEPLPLYSNANSPSDGLNIITVVEESERPPPYQNS